jgi:hypothetical protein
MSFESPDSIDGFGFDAAILAAIAAGIPVVTSAGNNGNSDVTPPCGYVTGEVQGLEYA